MIELKVGGQVMLAKGDFDYSLGRAKREPIMGVDRLHGFKKTPQVPYIEGKITDDDSLDLKSLLDFEDGTVTLKLANGKLIVLSQAYYAGDGKANTGEGEIEVRFEGADCEEV
jgi:hypothetical protein